MQGPLDSLALLLPLALAAASLAAVKFGSLHAFCLSGSILCVCVKRSANTDNRLVFRQDLGLERPAYCHHNALCEEVRPW